MPPWALKAWASGADDVARPGVRPAWGPRNVVGQDAEGGPALKQGAARCGDWVLRGHRLSQLDSVETPLDALAPDHALKACGIRCAESRTHSGAAGATCCAGSSVQTHGLSSETC